MGRPRKLKDEVGPQAATDIETREAAEEKFPPFKGRDELPSPQEVNGKMKYFPRYFMKKHIGTDGIECYKVMRIFRKRSGVSTMLIAQIKPNHRKRVQDKAFFERLKRSGVPGA